MFATFSLMVTSFVAPIGWLLFILWTVSVSLTCCFIWVGLLVGRRIGPLVDCCSVFGMLCMVCCLLCYLVHRLVWYVARCVFEYVVGYAARYVVGWYLVVGYVVDLICCWSADWLLCHCLSSLFGSSCFLMISCGGHYFRTHRESWKRYTNDELDDD